LDFRSFGCLDFLVSLVLDLLAFQISVQSFNSTNIASI
jgi:hypothetical protein